MQCLKMITVRHGGVAHKVPCGKCAFCLVSKRSSWMFRIYHEMRTQELPGWFVTLTYDEKHVRRTAQGRLSLRFRDVQLFIKKVRKKWSIKYICVGEYGSNTERPHYHLLIWSDCPPEKLESFWTSSKDGSRMGHLHVGRLTMASAMYTLKYIIQPKHKQTDDDDREKTRAQFSKGLGIGYLSSAMYEYHTFDYDAPVLMGRADGREVALPRYYRNKIFTKYQLRLEASKLKSKLLKDETKKFRELRAKGIRKVRHYLRSLRAEEARRIVEKTKVNEML